MTDQLRKLAEAEAERREVCGVIAETRFVEGFIAGRTSVTREQIEGAINALSWGYMVDGPSVAEIARTVHELLNGDNDD